MIWFNGYPFLDKEDHTFGVSVSQAMTDDVTSLPASGMTLRNLESLLSQTKFQGFPIINDAKILIGYIGRTELRFAVDKLQRNGFTSPDTLCNFELATDVQTITDSRTLELGRFIDSTPLTVHPRLPLETVMELFKKLGPRVILVERQGRLVGLVTVKDCLKFQFRVEAYDAANSSPAQDEKQQKLWELITIAAVWVADRVMSMSGGRVKLQAADIASNHSSSLSLLHTQFSDPRDMFTPIRADHTRSSTMDLDEGTFELHNHP